MTKRLQDIVKAEATIKTNEDSMHAGHGGGDGGGGKKGTPQGCIGSGAGVIPSEADGDFTQPSFGEGFGGPSGTEGVTDAKQPIGTVGEIGGPGSEN